LNSTPVIGAGNHPAYKNKRRTLSREPKAIRELWLQLHDMRTAAKPFLTNEARKVYWAQAWELTVVRAATRVESNRKEFYGLRLAAIISAITVPSLVGLNLSGAGGSAVRWLTFALSLIAALSTAILTLFRFADRWVMYRALSNGLMSAGWGSGQQSRHRSGRLDPVHNCHRCGQGQLQRHLPKGRHPRCRAETRRSAAAARTTVRFKPPATPGRLPITLKLTACI
jgi:hypothetical protein